MSNQATVGPGDAGRSTVFVGGSVFTGQGRRSRPAAVAVRGGRIADLAVLDRDPFDHPVDPIEHARVVRTYVHGELVYAARP